jgi:hypothetical protein
MNEYLLVWLVQSSFIMVRDSFACSRMVHLNNDRGSEKELSPVFIGTYINWHALCFI